MPEGLIESAAESETPRARRIYGTAVAQVLNNSTPQVSRGCR